eukprot:TRINITY_DN12454_c0_g2_i1.p1 TRINITY_DN12454_c0_g2~~TRINITY_DN12454_c0_g2_i1.p1  ORF type:complete len:209 (+),score=22.49 TRINITY_DN12454_c0_g2_i1:925-1551(+)
MILVHDKACPLTSGDRQALYYGFCELSDCCTFTVRSLLATLFRDTPITLMIQTEPNGKCVPAWFGGLLPELIAAGKRTNLCIKGLADSATAHMVYQRLLPYTMSIEFETVIPTCSEDAATVKKWQQQSSEHKLTLYFDGTVDAEYTDAFPLQLDSIFLRSYAANTRHPEHIIASLRHSVKRLDWIGVTGTEAVLDLTHVVNEHSAVQV